MQIYEEQNIFDVIEPSSVLVKSPGLLRWTAVDDPDPIYELLAEERDAILQQLDAWENDSSFRV